jgi:hypothetical protein
MREATSGKLVASYILFSAERTMRQQLHGTPLGFFVQAGSVAWIKTCNVQNADF